MFSQVLDPFNNIFLTGFVALMPVILLLFLLAVFRMTAWLATLIASIFTFGLALLWQVPLANLALAYLYGSLTGLWAIDWIVFWGLMIFNVLVLTGKFDLFKRWLIAQATPDVRVQAILLAWSFGALLEGLVGFGYPWAVVAPILISLGIVDIEALRVAALANNAPVSYGALGVPIITLAAVTGLPLMAVSASVGKIVALLALFPPWLLIYLVSGKKGLRDGWPLAIVGSLGYILGQFPTSQWIGPYLPDIAGSLVSFVVILIFLRFWKPKKVLGFGGKEVDVSNYKKETFSAKDVFIAFLPYIILMLVVVLGTGPWSPLPKLTFGVFSVKAISSITHKTYSVAFNFAPFVGGTFILISFIIIVLALLVKPKIIGQAFKQSFHQYWGGILTGIFILGLAYTYNYSGMASSLAYAFSKVGWAYILIAPLLGWIGVALSGSNTSTNAMFGYFQYQVGLLLGFPPLLLPSLNSVGAEIGKPVAPQTASAGVSTTKYVRKEGEIIRHNMGWTLVTLLYLIIIGVIFLTLLPGLMKI